MMNHPAAFDSPLFDEIKPFTPPDTRRIVGVRLRSGTRLVDCDTGGTEYKKGSWVVVDSGRGQRLAEVLRPSRAYLHRGERLPRVVRQAGQEDLDRAAKMAQREQDAFLAGVKVIQEKNLPFKLIAMEWADDGSKATAYFCSEDRVDFRDFVWDLSAKLHTRIEMRQVGIRDQSGMVGGIGDCGRELCCSSWLKGFSPISIKMAKNQGLALDNEKLTGQCGRLKCCLSYEDETYAAELRSLPKRGFKFDIEARRHVVISINALRRRVLVQEIETGAQFLLDSPIFNALLKKPEVATNSKLGFLDTEAERLAIEMAPTVPLPSLQEQNADGRRERTLRDEKAEVQEAKAAAADLSAALRESAPELPPEEEPDRGPPQQRGGGGRSDGGRDRQGGGGRRNRHRGRRR